MTTENTYLKYYGSNGCLNLMTYRAVIAGELSGKILDNVNAHLDSCELCREALEGLRQFPDDAAVIAGVKNLSNKINPPQTVFKPLYYAVSAAAVLLFAVGLGYQAFKGNESKEMDKAFANEFKPYPAPMTEESKNTDGGVVNEQTENLSKSLKEPFEKSPDKDISVTRDFEKKPAQNSRRNENVDDALVSEDMADVSSQDESEEVVLTDIAPAKNNNYSAPPSPAMQQPIATGKINADQNSRSGVTISGAETKKESIAESGYDLKSVEVQTISKTKSSPKNKKVSAKSDASAPEKEEPVGLLDRVNTSSPDTVIVSNLAMDYYRKGDFAKAVKLFDEVLARDPMRYDSRFYAGICFLETGNLKKAESYFKTLVASTGHSFSYPAKWYLALTMIKAKNKSDALLLLDEIKLIPGEYQQRARELAESFR